MKAKTRATLGIIVTVIIAFIGFSGYSSGNFQMEFFGIELSLGGFCLLLGAFIIFDVIAVVNASKAEKIFEEDVAITQAQLSEIEQIEIPCKVSITRLSSFWNSSVSVQLNGTEVGILYNDKTLDFTTIYSENKLTIQYKAGNTTEPRTFAAESGGSVHFTFNITGAVLTQD